MNTSACTVLCWLFYLQRRATTLLMGSWSWTPMLCQGITIVGNRFVFLGELFSLQTFSLMLPNRGTMSMLHTFSSHLRRPPQLSVLLVKTSSGAQADFIISLSNWFNYLIDFLFIVSIALYSILEVQQYLIPPIPLFSALKSILGVQQFLTPNTSFLYIVMHSRGTAIFDT